MDRLDRQTDLDLIRDAARAAGRTALAYFGRAPDVWHKAGGSPVSDADLAVDAELKAILMAARPHYGWLSEESDPCGANADTMFVIDPIDGTRGFLAGDERWAISIAIVTSGRPICATLFLPARNAMYWAQTGAGAWRDGTALTASRRTELAGARLAGPSGWMKADALAGLGIERHAYVPSLAYRLALVSENGVDGAFAKPGSHDWDLAAADLLVHEAGGRLTGLDGRQLRYGSRRKRQDLLVAAGGAVHGELAVIVRQIAGQKARAD